MPMLSQFALNAAFTALNVTQLSLHTAYSDFGFNEVVGGSYVRAVATVTVQNGQLLVSNLDQPAAVFQVPAGTTIVYVGMWDDTGDFIGMMPISSQYPLVYILSEDLTTVICPNGFSIIDGMTITTWDFPNIVGNPLVKGTLYQVFNATENTLQLATAEDPTTPLSFATVGSGFIQQVQPVTFTHDGTFTVSVITMTGIEIR